MLCSPFFPSAMKERTWHSRGKGSVFSRLYRPAAGLVPSSARRPKPSSPSPAAIPFIRPTRPCRPAGRLECGNVHEMSSFHSRLPPGCFTTAACLDTEEREPAGTGRPRQLLPAYSFSISMLTCLGFDSSFFGRTSLRTPSLYFAEILVASTLAGRVKLRTKLP